MKISDILKQDKVTLSFEVFPPKNGSSYESVAQATQEIAAGLYECDLWRGRRYERAYSTYRI